MKKWQIWIIGLLLLAGIVFMLLPLFIIEDKNQSISLSIEILTALSSILTLVIAVLLFDRFGIRNKLIDYQTESAIRLIEILRKTSCILLGKDVLYFVHFTQDLTDTKKYLKQFHDDERILLFHGSKGERGILTSERISEALDDLWLPDVIRKRLEFLEMNLAMLVKEEEIDRGKYIIAEMGEELEYYYYKYEGEITAIEFLTHIENLILEIKRWMDEHSNTKIDFNLRPI